MTILFDEATPLGANAQFTMHAQHHIIFGENLKRGWHLPSAFEIKASVTGPVEIYRSEKDRDSYFFVRPVGQVAGQRGPVQ